MPPEQRMLTAPKVDWSLELFILIVAAILTAKLIELGACWLFNLVF